MKIVMGSTLKNSRQNMLANPETLARMYAQQKKVMKIFCMSVVTFETANCCGF